MSIHHDHPSAAQTLRNRSRGRRGILKGPPEKQGQDANRQRSEHDFSGYRPLAFTDVFSSY